MIVAKLGIKGSWVRIPPSRRGPELRTCLTRHIRSRCSRAVVVAMLSHPVPQRTRSGRVAISYVERRGGGVDGVLGAQAGEMSVAVDGDRQGGVPRPL